MSNKRFSPDVDKAIWDKLREAQDKGLLPTTAFLDQAAEVGRKAAKQREILDKIKTAASELPFRTTLGAFIESVSIAVGIDPDEAFETLGLDCKTKSNEPSLNGWETARLLGLSVAVIKDMWRASCVGMDDLEEFVVFPHELVWSRVTDVASSDVRVSERLAHVVLSVEEFEKNDLKKWFKARPRAKAQAENQSSIQEKKGIADEAK